MKYHPHAPRLDRAIVRAQFRTMVAQQYGDVYTRFPLSLRRSNMHGSFYAPIVHTPGNVPVFFWPAVLIDETWLEPEPA